MTKAQLLAQLSEAAEAIDTDIERRQAALTGRLSVLEQRLYEALGDLLLLLTYEGGKLEQTAANFATVARIDGIWVDWQRNFYTGELSTFALQLLEVTELTGAMYADQAADVVASITRNQDLIHSVIGINEAGFVVRGSYLWEISQATEVRMALKDVVIRGIQSGLTLREFTKTIKDFVVGNPQTGGRLTRFWRTFAYDTFNRVAEVKNEQFREGLDLQWFLYVGDIILDSRAFCIAKAGKVFAVVEADTEWPKDKDLIGRKSGIPYTPRIDRGRWNCRHRIRYITRELAVQLDRKKVEAIEAKYA